MIPFSAKSDCIRLYPTTSGVLGAVVPTTHHLPRFYAGDFPWTARLAVVVEYAVADDAGVTRYIDG